MRLIRDIDPEPGGYLVTIEVQNAYTDGSSRLDRVHVPYSDIDGRDDADMLAAINERCGCVAKRLRGQNLDEAPQQTPNTGAFYVEAIQEFGFDKIDAWMQASPATVRAIDARNWALARAGINAGQSRSILNETERDRLLEMMGEHGMG